MSQLYKITIAKRIQGKWHNDWYSGQLEHMAKYGNRREANAHLCATEESHSADCKPQVVRENGTICEIRGQL